MRGLLSVLLVYGAQILVVVSVAAAAESLLRGARPLVRLTYWRSVGLLCAALPLAAFVPGERLVTLDVVFGAVGGGAVGPAVRDAMMAGVLAQGASAIAWLLAAGAVVRLAWLGLGLLRLRQMRRRSAPAVLDAGIEGLRAELAPRAALRWSDQVGQPVTFGLVSPVVLLPRTVESLTPDARRTVLCHELLHVARRDWPWILVEEVVRTAFWYHPAVWWLLARLDLCREQVVDDRVVRLTGWRRTYMGALVSFADRAGAVAPSIAFLRRRHLRARLRQLSREDVMTTRRLVSALVVLVLLVASAATITVAALPLNQDGSRQVVRGDADGVTPPRVVRHVRPYYTAAAMRARIEGRVWMDAVVETDGTVGDITVVRSLDREFGLDESAVDTVRQWRFEPGQKDGKPVPVLVTVEMTFTLRSDPEGR